MRNISNILIVDDSSTNQKLLKAVLERDGYSVYVASSVSEALKIIGNEEIGIVLIDFYLAGINTGDALVSKLRKYKVDIKMYSISSSEECNDGLMVAGCNGILRKDPVQIRKFLKENFPLDV